MHFGLGVICTLSGGVCVKDMRDRSCLIMWNTKSQQNESVDDLSLWLHIDEVLGQRKQSDFFPDLLNLSKFCVARGALLQIFFESRISLGAL